MDAQLAGTLAGIFGLQASQVHPRLSRADVSGWDSLKQMDLVVSIEEKYGLTLGVEDIVRMTSVSEIEAVLREKGVVLEP